MVPMTVTRTRPTYKSVDDYLGPAETRFFGRGFQRAEHEISDVLVRPDDTGRSTVRAAVSVGYPADWSRKGDNDLRPHLSTVDMLVLGVQLSEVALVHTYGLDEDQRRDLWLRKVTLTAGTTPQEDLIGLTGTAVPRTNRPAAGSPDAQVSVYDCAVGAMRARVEIEHPIGRLDGRQDVTYRSLGDALGAPALRYYGDGFKLRRQYVEDVLLDMAELRSTATVRLDPAGSELATQGTDGRYQPSVSLVDCFVANLQLAQVLMYELDGVTRRESNTLWMLRTVLETTQPMRPFAAPLPTVTAITGKHLVPLRGGRWRNVEIGGGCGGVNLRASFAHELPPSRAATAR